MSRKKEDAFADKQECKKAQEALNFQSILLANTHDAVVGYSLDNKVTYWNRAAEQLYGFTAEEALGRISYELLKPRYSRVKEREQIVKQINEAGRVEGESTRIRKDGGEVTIEFRSMLIRDGDGSPIGYVSLDRDITERRKLENQLRNNERLAAIGSTAGMVGHDIRNPLQSIINDLYLAKEDLKSMLEGEDKRSLRESLESIEENLNYINKIVADLQDYARPLSPVTQTTDLEKLCEEVLLKTRLPRKIQASCSVEENAKTIISDPTLIKRIIGNLVNNAVQAMPDRGNLEIKACRESDEVVITVQDTGLGVSDEHKDKLFTPLFTTKAKGQGFGLAVVKRMTEALGGTVTFESEKGKGTKFIIRLPAATE